MRVQIGDQAPSVYQALLRANAALHAFATSAGVKEGLLELLAVRVSQINRCAFCLNLHTSRAVALGESPERLALLPAWSEAGTLFTPRERAALALVEDVTAGSATPASDDVHAAASAVLSDAEIAAIAWAAIVMNAFNRFATTSRLPVPTFLDVA